MHIHKHTQTQPRCTSIENSSINEWLSETSQKTLCEYKLCNTSCKLSQSSSKCILYFKDLSVSVTEHLKSQFHSSEVLLMASTPLLMKAENIYQIRTKTQTLEIEVS